MHLENTRVKTDSCTSDQKVLLLVEVPKPIANILAWATSTRTSPSTSFHSRDRNMKDEHVWQHSLIISSSQLVFHKFDPFPFLLDLCTNQCQEPIIPGGVLLGILGGGVPPGSSNPDPISDLNMPFSTPVFRPELANIHPFSDMAL